MPRTLSGVEESLTTIRWICFPHQSTPGYTGETHKQGWPGVDWCGKQIQRIVVRDSSTPDFSNNSMQHSKSDICSSCTAPSLNSTIPAQHT
eukprot:scaffold2208_cov170-Ochromonas_danica.AAC.30